MLERITRKFRQSRYLKLALLGVAATFSACASQRPPPALVSDPDARSGSAIPWNKPETWEGQVNTPGGGFSSNPTFGGQSVGGH